MSPFLLWHQTNSVMHCCNSNGRRPLYSIYACSDVYQLEYIFISISFGVGVVTTKVVTS